MAKCHIAQQALGFAWGAIGLVWPDKNHQMSIKVAQEWFH